MLEILRRDHGGIVGDVRHPRTRLVSQVLNHLRRQRNGSMYPSACVAQSQDMGEASGGWGRLIGKGRHHGRDVGWFSKLFLRKTVAESAAKSLRGAGFGRWRLLSEQKSAKQHNSN